MAAVAALECRRGAWGPTEPWGEKGEITDYREITDLFWSIPIESVFFNRHNPSKGFCDNFSDKRS